MKSKKNFLLIKVAGILLFVVAIFASGFLFLDKIIIPNYFGEFGIHGVGDLASVISSLYASPNENKLITNGYSDEDLNSGIQKLQNQGYKIENNGTITDKNLENFRGEGQFALTDREFAALSNAFLKSEIFEESISELNYINTINITVLDLTITPYDESYDELTKTYKKANIDFLIRINTVDLRSQIATQMQTPETLLNIIIPNNLYFKINFDVDLTEDEYQIDGSISINGRNEKQSEILINLLLDFIFPPEDEMDRAKFTKGIGEIILASIETLGDFSFAKGIGDTELNGFMIG